MKHRPAAALILLCISLGVSGRTSDVTSAGFVASFHQDVEATPEQAWERITQISRWWGSGHTYSGNAANLTLEPSAGGCWCEKWGANSVQHARVLMSMPPSLLRLEGALGPLQALGATGVLTFRISKREGGSSVDVTYRVRATPDAALDKMAPAVDHVLEEQLGRLFGLMGPRDASPGPGK